MKKIVILSYMFALTFDASAQRITISGYIKDAASKEVLIGASAINANTQTGISTKQYGFFSLSAPITDTGYREPSEFSDWRYGQIRFVSFIQEITRDDIKIVFSGGNNFV